MEKAEGKKFIVSKRTVILVTSIMNLCVLAVSVILGTMSYRKYQEQSYVHSSKLNTVSSVSKINYAIGFEKPLDKFYGLSELLEEVCSFSDEIDGIEVLDQNQNVVEKVGDFPEEVRQSGVKEEYLTGDGGLYVFVDVDTGQLILYLNDATIRTKVKEYLSDMIKLAFVVLAGILLAVCILVNLKSRKGISVRRMKISCLVLMVAGQMVFGALSTIYVDRTYMQSLDNIAKVASKVLQSDLNTVIDKGVSYEEIEGIDDYLEHFSSDVPEFQKITIDTKMDESDSAYHNALDIHGMTPGSIICSCYPDTKKIKNNRLNNIIDVLILVFVAIFISIEGISFFSKHIVGRKGRSQDELYLPGFRLFVFIYGIAFSLDCGFISVLSNKLFWAMNLSPSLSFMSGMPNTMYSAAVLIGLFVCSFFISHFGMRKTMMIGVIAGVIGYILCAVAVNLTFLICARFVFGFCDGLVVNAVRLFASSQEDKKMHSRILVEYLAAINLGICCGVVIGGLIADVTSYAVVFGFGAVLGVISIFLVRFSGVPSRGGESRLFFIAAIKELRIRRVFVFMLFVVIPIYISTLFVGYTFPLFGDELGLSNAFVSGALMINYLIIAYLTDPISDWILNRIKPRLAVICYMILQALSIGLFVVTASLVAALIVLVLTSLWDCFGMVVIDSGLDDVEGSKRENTTLLQMIFGKAALSAGPMMVTARLSAGSAAATGVIVVFLLVGVTIYSFYEYGFLLHKKRGNLR